MGFTNARSCSSDFSNFVLTNTIVTTYLDPSLQPPGITTQTRTGWSPTGTEGWSTFANEYVVPYGCCHCEIAAYRVQVLYWPLNLTKAAPELPYELTSDGFTLYEHLADHHRH